MTGEELFKTFDDVTAKIYGNRTGNWALLQFTIQDYYNTLAAEIMTKFTPKTEDIFNQIMNLPYDQQKKVYKLLYAVGHRI
jgi:DNA polymerase III delta prime subunit